METERTKRLVVLIEEEPAVGAIVERALELEDRLGQATRALADAEARVAEARDALSKLEDTFPKLVEAELDIPRGLQFVKTGEGWDELPDFEPAVLVHDARSESTDALARLVRAGVINHEEQIYAPYKGKVFTAHLQRDLSILVPGYPPQPTLSAAGKLLTPSNVNGWKFWHVKRNGHLIRMDELRDAL